MHLCCADLDSFGLLQFCAHQQYVRGPFPTTVSTFVVCFLDDPDWYEVESQQLLHFSDVNTEHFPKYLLAFVSLPLGDELCLAF